MEIKNEIIIEMSFEYRFLKFKLTGISSNEGMGRPSDEGTMMRDIIVASAAIVVVRDARFLDIFL